MKSISPVLTALLFLLVRPSFGQLAPAGAIYVQQPSGVHYLFGSGGTATGGGFFYVNYLTDQFDVIVTTTSSSGSISGFSAITGRSISGQISSTSISLTYNGASINGTKLSYYGPAKAFAGGYCGVVSEPTFGISYATLAVQSSGVALLFTAGSGGVNIGVGSIDSSGHLSVTGLSGETITATMVLKNGVAQGTAQSSFGYTYTYTATRAIPRGLQTFRLGDLSVPASSMLIGGFIVKDGGKTVLINAKGPSLASQGVAAPLANPRLDLYLGGNVIASSDDWQTNGNASEITASGLAPTNSKEASLQVALEPGAYTAIVSSADGSQGIALVEAYGIE